MDAGRLCDPRASVVTGMSTPFTAWQTPAALFDRLSEAVGGFAVDAAANEENHLVDTWYGPGSPVAEDALSVPEWLNPAWCNPPYGKGLQSWILKFVEQGNLGVSVVALLPAYVEDRWWYEGVVKPGADVLFLVGRVPFERPGLVKASRPRHASAIVIYGPTAMGKVGWLDWRAKSESTEPLP